MYIWLATLIGPLLLTVLLKMPQTEVCGLAFNTPLTEVARPHIVTGDSISSGFWLSEKALFIFLSHYLFTFLVWLGSALN